MIKNKNQKKGHFIGDKQMIREIIEPKIEEYVLRIPKEYLNRKVEILILPLDGIEVSSGTTQVLRETAGLLSDQKIDPLAWQNEVRNEWSERI